MPSITNSLSVPAKERGVSLIVVLLLLVVVSMLGVASMQIATMGERGARNDRDMQLAWQSAENALVDAEVDLSGPNTAPANRTGKTPPAATVPAGGCVAGGAWQGFCGPSAPTAKPTWLLIDFTDTSNTAPSVAMGTFTGRTFANAGQAAGTGIQPALAPRYILEEVMPKGHESGRSVTASYESAAPSGTRAGDGAVYRVTAMGFGPRSTTQAVLQTIYRK